MEDRSKYALDDALQVSASVTMARMRQSDSAHYQLLSGHAHQYSSDGACGPQMNKGWLKLLPDIIERRLDGQHNLRGIIGNVGWLFVDKILRMGVGFFVTVWVIRYLGPARYGALNFAVAFVALFSVLATLGLESIVVRDIVHDPSCQDETLASAFVLKLIGGAVTLILAVAIMIVIRPKEMIYWWLAGIAAAATICQSLDVIDYWNQAEVRSRYTVYARNAAFITIAVLKIVLIKVGAPLVAFAWASLCEIFLVSMGLLLICRWQGRSLKPSMATIARSKSLLRQSWPLILSGLFVLILMRTDQVMLAQMRGTEEVGIFSAALAISEIWYFVPLAITSSVFPHMVRAWKENEEVFLQRLRQLYLLMVWLSLAVAVPLTLFSHRIIAILYGSPYQSTGTVLAIHCWAGVFLFLGVVSNMWYLLANLNQYTLYRCIAGAVINIGMNFLLIPKYGAAGAAISTLIAQTAASYLFDLMNKRTRVLFAMKSQCILFFIPLTMKYAVRAVRAAKSDYP